MLLLVCYQLTLEALYGLVPHFAFSFLHDDSSMISTSNIALLVHTNDA